MHEPYEIDINVMPRGLRDMMMRQRNDYPRDLENLRIFRGLEV